MKLRLSNVPGRRLAVLGLVGPAPDETGSSLRRPLTTPATLTGAWSIQVTRRDCTTGAALGPPSQLTRHLPAGGTLSENPGGGGFAIGQRGDGHGIWSQKGRRTYRQKFIALMNFDTPRESTRHARLRSAKPVSPGFFAGWQTVTHTLELVDANKPRRKARTRSTRPMARSIGRGARRPLASGSGNRT